MTNLKRSPLFIFIFFLLLAYSSKIYAQQIFKTTPTSVIGYLEYLPLDYKANSNKYPLVIFLHGIGERGPNTIDIAKLEAAIASVDNLGPPKHVKDGKQFPFILVSPQLKNNYSAWPAAYVMEVINYVKTYLRVDERRIHITGLSLGGYGAWTMAQDYPELFASVSPIAGAYNLPSKACKIAKENLPVWAFHGDKDTVVPLSRSVNMVNAINGCIPAPTPPAKLTIYPGVAHDSWNRAYQPDNTYHNPNVYQWIMSHINTTNFANKIPIANAGVDKVIAATSTTLTGNASDLDGTIVSYSWKQISGLGITIANASTRTVSLTALRSGTYYFRLTVNDNSGNTDSDYVKITVDLTNQKPMANAGADIVIKQPSASATISVAGTGTDVDGSIKSYSWKSISGPAPLTLTGGATTAVSLTGFAKPGIYTLSFTVTDDKGAMATDTVAIIVNSPPLAIAGSDATVTLPGNSVVLRGSGIDKDGSISYYEWTFSTGPTVPKIGSQPGATAYITGLTVPGKYVFMLRVRDNLAVSAFDHVTVTVINSPVSSSTSWTEEGDAATEVDAFGVPDFSQENAEYWKEKVIRIYNEHGTPLYKGRWMYEKYHDIFVNEGLYIITITAANGRVHSSKIFIRR